MTGMSETAAKSLESAITPDLHIYTEERPMRDMPRKDLEVVFAKCDTIAARMGLRTSLVDLTELVEKYVLTDSYRVVTFWALMNEWAYANELYDLSDMADMRYRVAKDQFATNRDGMDWNAVKSQIRS